MNAARLIPWLGTLSLLGCANGAPVAPSSPHSDTARTAEVTRAVDTMFAAMREHDADALRQILLEGAVIVHVGEQPDGSVRHATISDTQFIEQTAESTHALEERFLAPPNVQLDGTLATLWGRYELLVDGERHHCGVDAVQLARISGRWRVTAITYTARACD